MNKENRTKMPTASSIFKELDKGSTFNNGINLSETVKQNENFFIGKQWEGVKSNGLPTPVFNFLKRVVLFQVASILSENIKMQASPLAVSPEQRKLEQTAELISNEFDALFERNKIGSLLREFMRNAAVDGDGCLYTYWDSEAFSGQLGNGAIKTEIIENTRVHFGNPCERRVDRQPYILIESMEMLEEVRRRGEDNGLLEQELAAIKPESDEKSQNTAEDERVRVVLKLWKNHDTNTIWACECCRDVILRKPWDLKIRLYPITWLNWDYVQECFHGMAMITGLIPNQIFVNKTYAMVQMSLMQSAFPKTIFDSTRVEKWTNQVGAAIGVKGGNMNDVAKILEPAQISPQVSQFIESTISYTQTFLGATPAAMGDTRPDNTSAIIALQRASAVPSDLTRQNLYQSVEDLGNIYVEFMISNYGTRAVRAPTPDLEGLPFQLEGNITEIISFDFGTLRDTPMSLKLDVGASSYWSEIASMQTLDNLLMQEKIDVVDYLERIPGGYISKKQELIGKIRRAQASLAQPGQEMPGALEMPESGEAPEIPLTAGNSALQRKIAEKPA